MSEFGGLWKHENNHHALVPPTTECGSPPSGGGIKSGHMCYPSYGGTQQRKWTALRFQTGARHQEGPAPPPFGPSTEKEIICSVQSSCAEQCRRICLGDVAQWLVRRRNSNPKILGSIPWQVKGETQFFFCSSESAPVQICLFLYPPSCVRHAPKFVLKTPYLDSFGA